MRLKSKWFILFGIVAIACGLGLFIFTQVSINSVNQKSADILAQTEKIILEKTSGTIDEFSDMQMPAVEINGEDIIGVVEFETLGLSLPIGDKWSKGISYPKRFSGTLYDNSLTVGGYYCEGQFDCLKKLDIGNKVNVTDMTGAQFRFKVKDIVRKKSIDNSFLNDKDFDFTLFVRDSKAFEYIVVRCINE